MSIHSYSYFISHLSGNENHAPLFRLQCPSNTYVPTFFTTYISAPFIKYAAIRPAGVRPCVHSTANIRANTALLNLARASHVN